MSGPNRWEPLHRLSTLHTLLVAAFGGSAVAAVIKAIEDVLKRPNLPWWGHLSVAGLLSVLIATILMKARSKPATPENENGENGKLGIGERGHVNKNTPAVPIRITGYFHRVTIVRLGVVKETREEAPQCWVVCGFSIDVHLRTTRDVGIEKVELRTYKNQPPCQSLPPIVAPQRDRLDASTGSNFRVNPQIQYPYHEDNWTIPDTLEMVVTDEVGGEHTVHLKDGESLPSRLPNFSVMELHYDNR
jgi:membrane protein implicated in regulation of membrane protease activity